MSGSSYINGCLPLHHDRRKEGESEGADSLIFSQDPHTKPKVLAVLMIRNAKEEFCSSTTGREGGDDQRFPP